MVPGSQEKSKMKRGFADTSELKATLGSQFQQYLAKVAIASGLADALDRLEYHEHSRRIGKLCGGCKVPINCLETVETCSGCDRTTKCDRPGCKGMSNIHDCVICNVKNMCEGNVNFSRACVFCHKTVCISCENSCQNCPVTCIKCNPSLVTPFIRQWISEDAQNAWELEITGRKPEMLCDKCQENAKDCEKIMTTCQKCNDAFIPILLTSQRACKAAYCWRWVCPHGEPNEGYCPEHQPPSSTKKSKTTELN